MVNDEPTIDDGYLVIPPRDKPKAPKGVQCGACGMRFDRGTAYFFSCSKSDCPIQLRPTWSGGSVV